MVLLTKEVEVRWNNKNKKYYESLGYSCNGINSYFIVPIEHLSKGSHCKVEVSCDFCKEVNLIKYNSYNASKRNHPTSSYIDCCKKCNHLKIEKTNLKTIGVSYIFQTEKHKELLKNNIENIKIELQSRNLILISKDYIHSSEKLEFICKNHVDKGSQFLSWTELNRGYDCKFCSFDKASKRQMGVNNSNYNHSLSEEERIAHRNFEGYHNWRKEVFKRDSYVCQKCSIVGGNLVAHHKDGFHWCEKRRLDVENGATLCSVCHNKFHNIFGVRNNTEQQYKEFIRDKEVVN